MAARARIAGWIAALVAAAAIGYGLGAVTENESEPAQVESGAGLSQAPAAPRSRRELAPPRRSSSGAADEYELPPH